MSYIAVQIRSPGIWGVIIHDFPLLGVSRPTRNEIINDKPFDKDILTLPETVKARTSKGRVYLTDEQEWYWYRKFKTFAPPGWTEDDIENAWRVFMRDAGFICNEQGTNSRWSAVLQTNPGAGRIGVECIVTGGAVVRLVDGIKRARQTSEGVEEEYQVYCLDASRPLPIIPSSLFGMDGYTYFATNSKRDVKQIGLNWTITREDEVAPMGHLGRNHNLALFIANEDKVWLPAGRIHILKPGEIVESPYVL